MWVGVTVYIKQTGQPLDAKMCEFDDATFEFIDYVWVLECVQK